MAVKYISKYSKYSAEELQSNKIKNFQPIFIIVSRKHIVFGSVVNLDVFTKPVIGSLIIEY